MIKIKADLQHFAFQTIHDALLKNDILGHDEPTILNHLFKLTGVNPLIKFPPFVCLSLEPK